MENSIFRYSYWLGILCAGIAVLMRGGLALGIGVSQRITIWYNTFYRGAALLLLIAIASACYIILAKQKPQD